MSLVERAHRGDEGDGFARAAAVLDQVPECRDVADDFQ
jgi:hypothetical protein